MYARVYILSDGKVGKSVGSRIESFTLSLQTDAPKQLLLSGEREVKQGLGGAGGGYHDHTRRVLLRFTGKDLDRIFTFVLKHRLAGAKFRKQIREAHKQMTELARSVSTLSTRPTARRRRSRRPKALA